MIKKIMELASLIFMLGGMIGKVNTLSEGDHEVIKNKYLEASRELERILEGEYNSADYVESSKSNIRADEKNQSLTSDEIENQARNLMTKLKLVQYFQIAESTNKNSEIFNRFGFIDHLKEKISERKNNTSEEEQKEELEKLIVAIENYVNENSINAKKNRLKEMSTRLKNTLEHDSYKVLEDVLGVQIQVAQTENNTAQSSVQHDLNEKKKKFSDLVNAGKITDEQIASFWEFLQLQDWLVKVEKTEQSLIADNEGFFDAVESQANENEEAIKYKKEQEEWQNFLHELKEKLARLS